MMMMMNIFTINRVIKGKLLLTCIRWAGRNIHARGCIPADKLLQQENVVY